MNELVWDIGLEREMNCCVYVFFNTRRSLIILIDVVIKKLDMLSNCVLEAQ